MQERTSGMIRWGIVGTGIMAQHFAQDLRLAGGAELVAVSSRDKERAATFSAKHGGISAHQAHEALLKNPGVDAVYVATPNHTHFDIASAAIENGKAVLVEKPLAMTSSDVAILASLALRHGVFLMEGMWTRFLPAIARVRTLLESEAIGDVSHLRATLAFHHPYDPDSRFYSRECGGGSLLDLGIYGISLARHFFGEPLTVSGTWSAAPTGVDRSACLKLVFDRDVEAHVSCAFDHEGDNNLVIEGTRGTLVLPAPFIGAPTVFQCRNGLATHLAAFPGKSVPARAIRKFANTHSLPGINRHSFPYAGYGLKFEIEAASHAIRSGCLHHSLAAPLDTARTLEIVETVLQEANRRD